MAKMSENKSKDNMRGNKGFQADSTSSVRNVIQKGALIQTYIFIPHLPQTERSRTKLLRG